MLELMLAISVFVTSQTLRLSNEVQLKKHDDAEAFGEMMYSAMSAIDKRHSLDGYIGLSDWNASWSNTQSVLDSLFSQELVGSKNKICGDQNGWTPKDPDSNGFLALLPCHTFPNNAVDIPMSLKAYALRKGTIDDPTMIEGWSVSIYNDDVKDVAKYAKFYQDIIRGFNKRNNLAMTGDITASIVDQATSEKRNPSQCMAGVSCVIKFDYTPFLTSTDRYTYLRGDGENDMEASLQFHVQNKPAQCLDDAGVKVACGLDYDGTTVNLYGTSISISELSLTTSKDVVGVLCRDESNNPVNCGFSFTSNAGVRRLQSAFKGGVVDGTLEVIDPSLPTVSSRMLEVTKTGNVNATKLEAEQITAGGNVNIAETLDIQGNLINDPSHSESNIFVSETMNVGRIKSGAYKFKGKVAIGDRCTGSDITAEDPAYGGKILSCVNGLWQIPNAVPQGAIVGFLSNKCPLGWTPDVALNSSGEAVVSGPVAMNEQKVGVPNGQARMTVDTMPAHNHTYLRGERGRGISSGGGAQLFNPGAAQEITSGVAGHAIPDSFNIEPGFMSLMYCTKL